MSKMVRAGVWSVVLSLSAASYAERHYDFREELETVHEKGLRDPARRPTAEDYAFAEGTTVVVPCDADEVLENAARDFADYLFTSMGVGAGVGRSAAAGSVCVTLDKGLPARQYRVSVGRTGVRIRAADSRAAAQAFYHLEDLMNLRRAPFLKIGEETRTMRFRTRMVHSGWGMDLAPERYIERMAHYGFDTLLLYVREVGRTKSCETFADVNSTMRRAKRHGVDVWLYTSVKADVHPDDPGAQKVFDDTYGELARAYPEAKGLVLVGESCRFPSRDERTCADPFEVKQARGDRRPAPGWFPCRDYPAWLACVKKAIARHQPDMKVLFWTYNWASDRSPEMNAARMELIDRLPKENTVLLSTFALPGAVTFSNGHGLRVSDYSITCPGPSDNFADEAARAKADGLDIFTMCNTGGHTWDFGTSPYQPIPFQWAKRWKALVAAQEAWGLSGLMESHHYGWYPNFVSELAKEAYTEGGLPFEEHLRRIAARDFGERNADEAVLIWKNWSTCSADHPPSTGNQYGPFRIGPAYPYNFGGKRFEKGDFPCPPHATYGIEICHLNFTERLWGSRMWETERASRELPLLKAYATAMLDGADRFRVMAGSAKGREARKAREMALLAEYVGRSIQTAINTIRGAVAWEAGDKETVAAIAAEEYANAKAALPLVDADSRLGFECSMEYCGGREQIEWKLRRMEALFGPAVRR